MSRSPWHDINSSLTAAKLGLKLVSELSLQPKRDEREIKNLFKSISEKIDLCVNQLRDLRELKEKT